MAKASLADFTKRGRRLDLTDRIINSLFTLLIIVSISVFAYKLNLKPHLLERGNGLVHSTYCSLRYFFETLPQHGTTRAEWQNTYQCGQL